MEHKILKNSVPLSASIGETFPGVVEYPTKTSASWAVSWSNLIENVGSIIENGSWHARLPVTNGVLISSLPVPNSDKLALGGPTCGLLVRWNQWLEAPPPWHTAIYTYGGSVVVMK